jgi:DNA-binding NarL/FixJ family response regulator
MLQPDTSNTVFQLAADFVINTSQHLFITGKAGTGKTTFLKYIKENIEKNAVVVAPTGVAAINAGGVTMHSFFQLPFGPFIPGTQRGFGNNNTITDRHSLFKNIRFNADKRKLLEELDLLIIDEVSMVRADMLDAMDTILRHFRKKLQLPFGGVQVVYIGDMYQLPPVVANDEWDILGPYYESPFFFHAQVIQQAPPLYIELKKIYRQNEQRFIDLLNNVRHNAVTDDDFDLLNSRYDPDFNPPADDKYITLSTHNRRTDAINSSELEKLAGRMYTFRGTVTGDFSEKAFPTDIELQLKVGSQVMFIKNDSGMDRKFFNGKLATIKSIGEEEIKVSFNDGRDDVLLEKETWRNIRYTYNRDTGSIEEEELGSFTQYPVRLAWAITIHKSQGLTFEKAIIDAGSSFAAGQVYVALSRCTSLHGMVLRSRIQPSTIATDGRVIAFAKKESAANELELLLDRERQQYHMAVLIKSFEWTRITDRLRDFVELVPDKKLPDINSAVTLSKTLLQKAEAQGLVADRFRQQLQQVLDDTLQSGHTGILEERVSKAIAYFVKAIAEDLLQPLQQHIISLKHAAKVRKYLSEVAGIEAFIRQQLLKLVRLKYGELVFVNDVSIYTGYEVFELPDKTKKETSEKVKKEKPVKGQSQQESLSLFRDGVKISEIAKMRNLTEGTVGVHLAAFVRTGEVRIHELVTEERVDAILPIIKETGGPSLVPVKDKLGDDYSFSEIRAVYNYWQWLQEQAG